MAGRALVFSNAEIIRIVTENFVPVAGDDWYRRRQQDEVGRFFRKVALERGRWDGDSTRQGLYCFTAEGKLLSFRNTTSVAHVKRFLEKGLAAWRALDPAERRPRELASGRAAEDSRFARSVPDGALVVRVHARELDREPDGTVCKAARRRGYRNLGSVDHLWVRSDEWTRLVPAKEVEVGATYAVDGEVAHRIARFHLVDNTRGEPPFWRKDEVRRVAMTLTVRGVDGDRVRLELAGDAHLETRKGDRGFVARLRGALEYDRAKNKWTRFDAVAIGEHWGRGRHTRNARPGKSPLGIAFVLADGSTAADRVPPQAARDLGAYFRAR